MSSSVSGGEPGYWSVRTTRPSHSAPPSSLFNHSSSFPPSSLSTPLDPPSIASSSSPSHNVDPPATCTSTSSGCSFNPYFCHPRYKVTSSALPIIRPVRNYEARPTWESTMRANYPSDSYWQSRESNAPTENMFGGKVSKKGSNKEVSSTHSEFPVVHPSSKRELLGYRTTNREYGRVGAEIIAQHEPRYLPMTQHFTQSFHNLVYRYCGLSTAKDESRVQRVDYF